LLNANPVLANQFTIQLPQRSFLAGQPRKQSGTADEQNPFLLLFPELRRASAPKWLKEGVRVTYRVESASVAQQQEASGSAGAGLAQYDLVALDQQAAVTAAHLFLDTGDGALIPATVMRFVGLPGAGEYWINPQVLDDAERVASDNLAVMRMPQQAGGKTYNSVRFVYQMDGAEYVWAFDRATGLLLFYRHAIGDDNSPHRQLTQITFVKQRQLKVPWRATAAPEWAVEGARLKYQGTYGVLIQGTDTVALPFEVTARVTRNEGRWTECQMDAVLQRQTPNKSVRVSGVAQLFDALWLPSEAIKRLKNGDVLDRDPTTGTEVRVSRRHGLVVITESGERHRTELIYDEEDGALIGIRQDTRNGAGTVQIDVKLVERR
jgi:hypothetical protein